MDFSQLQTGIERRPLKIVLTGVEGVGKTTFAADAPAPIFADLEQGSSTLDVTRFPDLETWDSLIDAIGFLYTEKHEFKTLVVDSMSVAERLAGQKVAEDNNVKSVAEIGYGKGQGIVATEFDSFLRGMDSLIKVRNMNIILVCHSVIRRFDDPAGDSFDQYAIALAKQLEPKIKQWGDTVLFADHDKTTVEKGEGFNKRRVAKSFGDRVLYTQHRASHNAKNRFNLPEKLPLKWSAFEQGVNDFYKPANKEPF